VTFPNHCTFKLEQWEKFSFPLNWILSFADEFKESSVRNDCVSKGGWKMLICAYKKNNFWLFTKSFFYCVRYFILTLVTRVLFMHSKRFKESFFELILNLQVPGPKSRQMIKTYTGLQNYCAVKGSLLTREVLELAAWYRSKSILCKKLHPEHLGRLGPGPLNV
jgi:hypothetical protein